MKDPFEPCEGFAAAAPVKSLWKHRKGGTYRVLGVGMIEATMTPAVIYESLSRGPGYWIRPAAEFLDGRFERITKERP